MKYYLTHFRMAIAKRMTNYKPWWVYGEKRTLVHWWCTVVQSLWKIIWRFTSKLKMEPPCDSTIPLLGIYSKKMKTLFQKDICIPIYIHIYMDISLYQQPTRLPHLWDSPGKNTGVGCHCLLQCRKVQSESEIAESCPTLSDPMDCGPPGSSIHGIFQARVLEWGAIAFSTQKYYSTKKEWNVAICNNMDGPEGYYA